MQSKNALLYYDNYGNGRKCTMILCVVKSVIFLASCLTNRKVSLVLLIALSQRPILLHRCFDKKWTTAYSFGVLPAYTAWIMCLSVAKVFCGCLCFNSDLDNLFKNDF